MRACLDAKMVVKNILTVEKAHEEFAPSGWQRVLLAEFETTLLSKTRPFPCLFGVSGLKSGQVRVTFPDPLTPESLAPILAAYLGQARSFGAMTSLVAFARPGPVRDMEHYRSRLWSLLDGLERLDTVPRPADIPREIDSPAWEFCYAGEPIFVVCNTPAHVLRQSRRSTAFMVTFQPRWVFDGIVGNPNPAVQRSLKKVRERLHAFDAIPEFPYLGEYGDPENREYQQYFIDDTNQTQGCPFHRLGQKRPAANQSSKPDKTTREVA